jgi:hypothetical protein
VVVLVKSWFLVNWWRGYSECDRTRRSVLFIGAIVVALTMAVTSCTISSIDSSLAGVILTPYGSDTLAVALEGDGLVVRAPAANQAGAIRIAAMPVASPDMSDQQSCATWQAGTGHYFRQEGAALRMRTVDGVTHGITITKGVWLEEFWIFNVHTWDTSVPTTDTTSPATLIGSFDLKGAFGTGAALKPLPWRMCARVINDVVAFKVWPLTVPEPSWTDATYGGAVRLPAGAAQTGRPGWYSGHLQPASSVVYTSRSVTDLAPLRTARTAGAQSDGLVPRTPTAIPSMP